MQANRRIRKVLCVAFLIFLSASCAEWLRSQYILSTGVGVCIPDQGVKVISATPDEIRGRYKYLLLDIEDLPFYVSHSLVGDVQASRTKAVSFEGVTADDYESYEIHKEIFEFALSHPESVSFDEEWGLYRLKVDNSAGDAFRLLKLNPRDISGNVQPEETSDWYLGLCTDGFGGEGSCFFTYPVKGVVISYQLKRSFMKNWQRIVEAINSRVETLVCEVQ